jgi:hypothetical protein
MSYDNERLAKSYLQHFQSSAWSRVKERSKIEEGVKEEKTR